MGHKKAAFALGALLLWSVGLAAQAQTPPQAPAAPALPAVVAAAVQGAERSNEPFTLSYFNRPIVVLRANVLGRPPAERAALAVQVLDDLVVAKATEPKAPESKPSEPKPFASAKVENKAIEAKGRTVMPGALLTESLPVLVVEPPAGVAVAETRSTPPAPAPTKPPLPAKTATLPPATPATPAPEAPNANTAGGFSIARQLGLGVSRIVIDPGHGGHDPGAQGKGLNESELTLDIALRLEEMLKKEPGVEVVLTRRTDEYIPLEERTAIANRESADLFLSIHANASRSAVASGVETYFLSFAATPEAEAVAARENSAHGGEMHKLPDMIRAIALNNKLDESRDLAGMVQEAMVSRLRRSNREIRNLGVKKAPFVVLIGAGMPSVLAEVSFVTNRQELQLLKTPAYKDRIAEALHAAIIRYRRSLKGASAIAAQ